MNTSSEAKMIEDCMVLVKDYNDPVITVNKIADPRKEFDSLPILHQKINVKYMNKINKNMIK